MAVCSRCDDLGFYTDLKCEKKECNHSERRVLKWKWVTATKPDGKTYDKQIPALFGKAIMECPQRMCICPAGKRYKRVPASPGKAGWRLIE